MVGEVSVLVVAVILLRMLPLGHHRPVPERPVMAREFAADAAIPPRWSWWLFVVALAVALIAVPDFIDISLQLDLSIIFVLALLALSMSFLWGYVGMLSFGQTIFFGLGGYSYAILALNIGSTLSFAAAICLPMIFAAILGYFMIYGRISDIYLSVITLVVTLIFEKSIRSTSGPEFVIGSVRLNGQNGIPDVPSLQLPWDGPALSIDGVFCLAGGCCSSSMSGCGCCSPHLRPGAGRHPREREADRAARL